MHEQVELTEAALGMFVTQQERALKAELNQFELIHRGPVSIEGHSYIGILYEWALHNGTKTRQHQLYLPYGSGVLVLTTTPSLIDDDGNLGQVVSNLIRGIVPGQEP